MAKPLNISMLAVLLLLGWGRGAGGETAPFRIMCIGNSITTGANEQEAFRYHLCERFKKEGYRGIDFVGSLRRTRDDRSDYSWDCDHEGHDKYRADMVLKLMPAAAKKYRPTIALIHLGTNDMRHGNTVASTISEIKEIITVLRTSEPSVAAYVAKIIPGRRFGNEFRKLNAAIGTSFASMSTGSSPVAVVDQYTGFDPKKHLADDWHPNPAGARLMAGRWFDAVAPHIDSLNSRTAAGAVRKTGSAPCAGAAYARIITTGAPRVLCQYPSGVRFSITGRPARMVEP